MPEAAVVKLTVLLNTMVPPAFWVQVLLLLALYTTKLNVCVAVELLVSPPLISKYFALVVPNV
ncbi:MAG: hypothetical protein EBT08_15125 [Betaproteobacteria bacterium]|nr:hypothetical protein [Betaproteobacteria bacterium]